MPPKSFDYSKTINRLSNIVKKMEDDDLSLEDSLKAFEEGIKLTREAQQTLTAMEQKIQMMVESNGGPVSQNIDGADKNE